MKPTRRKFIQQTALLSTAMASHVSAQDSETPKTKMTKNLVPGAIGVKVSSQRELNDLAHRHGFQSVEPRAAEFANYSQLEMDVLQADLKEKNLSFGSTGLPVDFRKDGATFKTGLAKLPSIAAALKKAGGTRMNTWIKPGSNSLTYIQNFNQHALRLREVARILGDHGIKLGLEYVGTLSLRVKMKFPFVHCMTETAELITGIGATNVGYVLDSWHWWTALENSDDIAKLTNDQIIAVDLNDAPVGIRMEDQQDNRRELPAATGVIDLRSFLNTLNKLEYDGPVRAEPFNKKLSQMENEEACAKTSTAMDEALGLIW